MSAAQIVVERAGALTTVQDHGRPGYAHLGVPRSGALDIASLHLANRAVGNDAGAAGLETTLTGVALRATASIVVAVAGAPCSVQRDGVPVAWGAPVMLRAGQILDVGPATHGVRSYVAIRGGVAAAMTLGSRSADLLSGLGPAPVTQGDVLDVGPSPGVGAAPAAWPGPVAAQVPAGELVLPVRLGPRDDWFTPHALALMFSATFTVSESSNRVGLRLRGPQLERRERGELVSEGMVRGAVQVPPDGAPVVFLADHPVTGGYPVIGVVSAAGVAAAAQARPGMPARFTAA